MDELEFKHLVTSLNYKVKKFESHPQVFGSWLAVIKADKKEYRIVYEGRDTHLQLQKVSGRNKWLNIKGQYIHSLGPEQELNLIKQWLNAT